MWALQQSAPSDAEARAWFEKNAALVRTRRHVLQLLYKGERAEALKDAQDLKGGAPFEELAARRYGALPAGSRAPWDLGEIAWHQLPPQWRGVVDRLEPGQVSGLIEGEGDRAWIVKLVASRVEPTISFETERSKIVDVLRSEKARELYDRVLAEAKAKADVSFAKAN